MSDLPVQSIFDLPPAVITCMARCSDTSEATQNGPHASGVWPAANLAIYMPFRLVVPVTVYQLGVYNGAAVSGNLDVGIYDALGNLQVSKGSTAQSGTNASQFFDVTDTPLTPGLYYMAICVDNTTAALDRWATGLSALALETMGVQQQAVGAVTLPSTATFAVVGQAYLPNWTIALHPVI